MDEAEYGENDVSEVDDGKAKDASNELDDADLAAVAGGTNWHPEKDDRPLSPRWDPPEDW